jgi:hypothetical protein
MPRNCRFWLAACAAVALLPTISIANPIIIQPAEADSKDVFVYEFLPTFNFDGGQFGTILGAGKTGIGHDFQSLLQFDLTGVTLGANEQATLNLYVGSTSSAGFGNDPTAATPVTDDVFPITQAWGEATATWGNQPSTGATSVGSTIIDSIDHYVSFDITAQVQSWLNDPSSNLGVLVSQRDIVGGGQTAAIFDSSAGTNRPFLQIAAVPEPATAGMAAIVALGALSRRRRHA